MNHLKQKLHNVRSRLSSACKSAGRDPAEVTLLAVSKKHSSDRIRELHRLGQPCFGENYVREALEKMKQLSLENLEWHYIGPLQSNKTREVAENFHWVQSIDRLKIARRLSDQRPEGKPPLNICIQVNIDREPQKGGVMPEQVKQLAGDVCSLPNLHLRGLMAIPRAACAEHDPADSYQQMQQLFRQLIEGGLKLDTLSMGMSADLEAAIMHGSTMVRIGTDLFGPRPASGIT